MSGYTTKQILDAVRMSAADTHVTLGQDVLRMLAKDYSRLLEHTTWRPIAEHDGNSELVLLLVPMTNGLDSPLLRVVGFFAKAGTQAMDGETDESLVSEDGSNLDDAWFEVSAHREPFARIFDFTPTHFAPLPPPPGPEPR